MTVGRNDLCPCGSKKKYKKCCGSSVEKKLLSDKNSYYTDKFCTLWCCKDFFTQYTKDWNIKILVEGQLGNRYFTKFESMSRCITDIYNDAIDNNIYFADTANKHIGIVLEENGPFCMSKFSNSYKGVPCVDGECNNPNLTIYSKYICALMCCTECNDDKCVSKQPCDKIVNVISQIMKMVGNVRDTSLEDILNNFFEKRYKELIVAYKLNDKLPWFIKI